MKKTAKFWNILMFVVMMMLVMVSCGGNNDDSNSGSTPNVVDGPTIWSGKRISELRIFDTDQNGKPRSEHPSTFKCEYDSKGRLSKIISDAYVPAKGYTPPTKSEITVSFDYGLQVVSILDSNVNRDKRYTYSFNLNKDGYFSQFDKCLLSYENGYLTEVEQSKMISSIVYEENEIIKASITNLMSENVSLFYVTYGNVDYQGDLYVRVRYTEGKTGRLLPDLNGAAMVFIAYQAGLFGKVSKHFIHLQDKNAESGIFDLESESETIFVKFSFTCE